MAQFKFFQSARVNFAVESIRILNQQKFRYLETEKRASKNETTDFFKIEKNSLAHQSLSHYSLPSLEIKISGFFEQ